MQDKNQIDEENDHPKDQNKNLVFDSTSKSSSESNALSPPSKVQKEAPDIEAILRKHLGREPVELKPSLTARDDDTLTRLFEKGKLEDLPLSLEISKEHPQFHLFSFDAEKVMDILGIKRSRLNQISGESLRVARVKVDRYTRPFFRPEDVEKYLEWTRATASHQKSSDLLSSAIELLMSATKDLKSQFSPSENIVTKGFLNQQKELRSGLWDLRSSLSRDIPRKFTSLLHSQSSSLEKLSKRVDLLSKDQLQRWDSVDEKTQKLLSEFQTLQASQILIQTTTGNLDHQLSTLSENYTKDQKNTENQFNILKASLEADHERNKEIAGDISLFKDEIQDKIDHIQSSFDTLAKSLQTSLNEIQDALETANKESSVESLEEVKSGAHARKFRASNFRTRRKIKKA